MHLLGVATLIILLAIITYLIIFKRKEIFLVDNTLENITFIQIFLEYGFLLSIIIIIGLIVMKLIEIIEDNITEIRWFFFKIGIQILFDLHLKIIKKREQNNSSKRK